MNRKRRQNIAGKAQAKPKNKITARIFGMLYYIALVLIVLVVFLLSNIGSGSARTYAGFGAFIVMSGSMEDAYPKDSLIIVRKTDADKLEIGDDITYIANESTVVTHRIIEIRENYEGTGKRLFRTQGIMNPTPDANPVIPENIIGRVVWHSYLLGTSLLFVTRSWPLIVFLAVIAIVLAVVLRMISESEKDQRKHKTRSQRPDMQNQPTTVITVSIRPIEPQYPDGQMSFNVQVTSTGKEPIVVQIPTERMPSRQVQRNEQTIANRTYGVHRTHDAGKQAPATANRYEYPLNANTNTININTGVVQNENFSRQKNSCGSGNRTFGDTGGVRHNGMAVNKPDRTQ